MSKKATAEYYELWGTLLRERAKLSHLEATFERTHTLRRQHPGFIPAEEFDSTRYALLGQRQNVEKLEAAVEEMRTRAALTDSSADDLGKQFRPQLVQIETLQSELTRLRGKIEQGQLRSPVNGRVMRMRRFTGEYSDTSEPLLDVLEDNSLEVVLYLPQAQANRLEPGTQVNVRVVPSAALLPCTVHRLGDQFLAPPENLERHFRAHQRLLPVYLRPEHDRVETSALRLGSEVRLPRRWSLQ